MRKITNSIILVLTLSFLLPSCSKDDDGPSTSGNIVGKWEFFKEGERIGSTEELFLYEHQAGCAKDNITFNSDGTFDSATYDTDCSVFSSSGEYVKSGNTLTTSFGEVEIKQLDGSTLKVYETYTEGGETFTDVTVLKRAN